VSRSEVPTEFRRGRRLTATAHVTSAAGPARRALRAARHTPRRRPAVYN